MRRLGQPAVIGELAAGVLLGPSVFGLLAPAAHAWLFPAEATQQALLTGVRWLGVFLLLILVGVETDLDLVRRMRRAAGAVVLGSLTIPFASGLAVGLVMPADFFGPVAHRGSFALFMGTALSLSALPVIAKILSDLDLLRRNIGQIILAAAMADDLVGWTLLGVTAGFAQSGSVSAGHLVLSVGGVALLLLFAFTLGQRGVDSVLREARRRRAGLVGGLTLAILVALAGGMAAEAVGIEAIFGAFIAGILIGRSRFQDNEVLSHLEAITLSVFAPLYFATAGLRVDLTLLSDPLVLYWSGLVLAAGCLSKLFGAWLGAGFAGLPQRERMALGVGLNARGAVEIVVATVGLSLGVLNASSYTAVVLLAMATSLMAPPLLRALLREWPGSAEEQRRLEEERRLQGNVLLRPQPLLLPSHGGPNSRLAARIVDLIWPVGSPVTVLSAGPDVRQDEIELVVSAFRGRAVEHEHVPADDPLGAILDHAHLGYGAIALGATDQKIAGALVSPMVDALLAASPVPVIMVRIGADLDPDAAPEFRRVLVPAIGTRPGRAAQEVAFAAARRFQAEVLLANVVTVPGALAGRGYAHPRAPAYAATAQAGTGAAAERSELAAGVVGEAQALAAEHGVRATPAIRTGPSVPEEILALAREQRVDLVVLATEVRQASGRPFLGQGVEFILANSDLTVVVVTAPPG